MECKTSTLLPNSLVIERDINYACDDNPAHTLDVLGRAELKDNGYQATLINIYGGAWCSGENREMEHLLAPLLEAGVLVFNVNHSHTPEFSFPVQVHEMKAAVRWVRLNAERFGGNGKRIGVLGFSSGGHLAAMLGTTNGQSELEGNLGEVGVSSAVQAVVGICGPYDLTDFRHIPPDGKQAGLWLIGEQPEETFLERAKMASPAHLVTSACPPFMVIQGNNDYHVPNSHAETMLTSLRKRGVPHESIKLKHYNHEDLILQPVYPDTIVKPIIEFFKMWVG